jgi:hypothetical protein
MHRSDLEILLRNSIWKEMKNNASDLMAGLIEDLGSLDPMQDPTQISRTQGKIQTLKMVFDEWIEDIKRDIEEQEEETRNGTT